MFRNIEAVCFIFFVENGEDIQVLRYEHGQKYDPHYDYFTDKVNIARGGHRIATVLMYLSNVVKGGETVFPSAEVSLVSANTLFFFILLSVINRVCALVDLI